MLLVDGQTVQIPTPKNIYARDIYLERDTPIFAKEKAEIKYTLANSTPLMRLKTK